MIDWNSIDLKGKTSGQHKEVWKDVKNWEGKYQVSDLGRIKTTERTVIDKAGRERHIKPKVKKQSANNKRGSYMYVSFQDRIAGVNKTSSVHRVVAEAFLFDETNKDLIVDHINGNRTDNRLSNLQLVTYRQNTHKGNLSGDTSKHRGVCWHRRNNKWMASLYHNGKQHHLGYFDSELDAKKAYDKKLKTVTND